MSTSPQDTASPPHPEPSAPPAEVLPRTTDIGATHIVCPHCGTANRLTRTACVQCERDLSVLRVVANKAKHHFNTALEHAERRRWDEAIVELKNCLDLDASHVSAWVVLGTCLAKLERFEEAREAWQRALAIDPRFAKAHDYLGRVEQMPVAVRYRRRLRLVTLLLVVAIVGGAWHALDHLRMDPRLRMFAQALQMHRERAFGPASEMLDEMLATGPGPELALAAQALQTAMAMEFQGAMDAIRMARAQQDWRAALEACQRLLAMRPPRSLAEQVDQRAAEFAGRLLEEAAARVAAIAAERASPEAVLAELSPLPDLMPTPGLRGEMETLVASAEAVAGRVRAERFAALLAERERALEGAEAEERLRALLALLPAWGDQPALAEATDEAARLAAEAAEREWQSVQSAPTAEPLRAFMERTRALLEAATLVPASAEALRETAPGFLDAEGRLASLRPLATLLASAEAALPEAERRAALAQAEAQVSAAEWAAALDTLAGLDEAAVTGEERERAAALRRRAAVGLFEQLLAADRAYETLSLSQELARSTVTHWETVVAEVPDRLYGRSFRTEYALFYAARAWEKLGEPARAVPLYQRITQDFPGSDHAEAAERHLARLASVTGDL